MLIVWTLDLKKTKYVELLREEDLKTTETPLRIIACIERKLIAGNLDLTKEAVILFLKSQMTLDRPLESRLQS